MLLYLEIVIHHILSYIPYLDFWVFAYSLVNIANADTVVSTIPVGIHHSAIAYSPRENAIYVANYGQTPCDDPFGAADNTASITYIDQNDNPLTTRTRGEDCFSGIAYNPSDGKMYVTTGGDDSVVLVQNGLFLNRMWSTDDNPMGIAYNPDDNRMYTANKDDNDVTIIDSRSPFPAGELEFDQSDTLPIDIAFNPTTHKLYVTQNALNAKSVTAIDTRGGPMIPIPNLIGQPWGIAFGGNDKMYVTTSDHISKEGKVVVINGANIGESIPVGHDPKGIAYNPDKNKIYVANEGDSTVSVIYSTTN